MMAVERVSFDGVQVVVRRDGRQVTRRATPASVARLRRVLGVPDSPWHRFFFWFSPEHVDAVVSGTVAPMTGVDWHEVERVHMNAYHRSRGRARRVR